MQSIEKTLTSFFKQVAIKNRTLLNKLELEQCFAMDTRKWQFTLPDLYTFLKKEDNVFNSVDYISFRNILFKSSINQTVKLHGAEIKISDNQAKVDKSHYALIWK